MTHDSPRVTPIHWLIGIVAAIGFAFDIYEIPAARKPPRPASGTVAARCHTTTSA